MRKITQKQIIFWILLENARNNGNEWLSAGAFCDKEVDMRYLGYRWISYKGATRISDTVYEELPASWIERQYFNSRNGTKYYKYRLTPKNKITVVNSHTLMEKRESLPEDYKYILKEFKKIVA